MRVRIPFDQSKLIVSEKIRNELMGLSPMLRREILKIKDNQNEVIVFFRNKSTITVVPASENGRGYRSNCVIREEFRQISKSIDDSIKENPPAMLSLTMATRELLFTSNLCREEIP